MEKELLEKVKSEVTETMKTMGLTAEQIEEKIKALNIPSVEGLASNEEVEKLKTELTQTQEKLTALESGGAGNKSTMDAIAEAVKEKHADIVDAEKKGSGMVSIIKLKTDNTPEMTTARVTPLGTQNAIFEVNNANDRGDIRLRELNMLDFVTYTPNWDESTFSFTDIVPIHDPTGKGVPTIVAEGNLKPKIAFKEEVRIESAVVIAAHMTMTKQAIRNIRGMAEMSNSYLRKQVILKANTDILDIVKAAAPNWSGASWTHGPVGTPNLVDCVVAAANQVAKGESWLNDEMFYPTLALVNYGDWLALGVKKSLTNEYLWENGLNEKVRVTFVPMHHRDIEAGKILVGDFSKAEVFGTLPFELSAGWINDEFIRNKFTLLGETEHIRFVRHYNKRAFVYANISDIVTTLEGS